MNTKGMQVSAHQSDSYQQGSTRPEAKIINLKEYYEYYKSEEQEETHVRDVREGKLCSMFLGNWEDFFNDHFEDGWVCERPVMEKQTKRHIRQYSSRQESRKKMAKAIHLKVDLKGVDYREVARQQKMIEREKKEIAAAECQSRRIWKRIEKREKDRRAGIIALFPEVDTAS